MLRSRCKPRFQSLNGDTVMMVMVNFTIVNGRDCARLRGREGSQHLLRVQQSLPYSTVLPDGPHGYGLESAALHHSYHFDSRASSNFSPAGGSVERSDCRLVYVTTDYKPLFGIRSSRRSLHRKRDSSVEHHEAISFIRRVKRDLCLLGMFSSHAQQYVACIQRWSHPFIRVTQILRLVYRVPLFISVERKRLTTRH